MYKRGLSSIIVAVMMVLISLGAVTVIGGFIFAMVQNASDSVSFTSLLDTTSIDKDSVYVSESLGIVEVTIKRGNSEEVLQDVTVILTDVTGKSAVQEENVNLGAYDSARITVNYASAGLSDLAKISLSPTIVLDSGDLEEFASTKPDSIVDVIAYKEARGGSGDSDGDGLKDYEDPCGTIEGPVCEGLLLYWTFDGTGADASGNGHSATIIGASMVSGAGVKGSSGAVSLDGSNDMVLTMGTFDDGGSTAISIWANRDELSCSATNNWRSFVRTSSTLSATRRGWDVVAEQGGAYQWDVGVDPLSSNRLHSGISTPIGVWRHIVFNYDASSGIQELWIDNVKIVERVAGGPIIEDTSFALFSLGLGTSSGCPASGSGFWGGDADEVMIFDRALTPGEISMIYNYQKP